MKEVIMIFVAWTLSALLTPDLLVLTDGVSLAGRLVENANTLQIETLDGPVEVLAENVISITPRSILVQDYKIARENALDAGSYGWMALSGWCRKNGLYEEMLDCLDETLKTTQSNRRALELIDELIDKHVFLETETIDDSKSFLKYVRTFDHRGSARRLIASKRLGRLLDEVLGEDKNETLSSLRGLAKRGRDNAQLLALELLLPVRDKITAKTLLDIIIHERKDVVRHAATSQLANHEPGYVLPTLAKNLGSGIPEKRERVLNALAEFPNPASYALMITHMARLQAPPVTSTNAGSTRAFIFTGTIHSYVADYETEIATNAFIAKPIVRQAVSGQVLDVRIFGVSGRSGSANVYEQQLTAKLLGRATGQNFGLKSDYWQTWWNAKYRK